MKRLLFLFLLFVPALNAFPAKDDRDHGRGDRERFEIVEASIPEIQHALETHRINSKQLVKMYLERIAAYERTLNGVIAINWTAFLEPTASMSSARKAECEARSTGSRSPSRTTSIRGTCRRRVAA